MHHTFAYLGMPWPEGIRAVRWTVDVQPGEQLPDAWIEPSVSQALVGIGVTPVAVDIHPDQCAFVAAARAAGVDVAWLWRAGFWYELALEDAPRIDDAADDLDADRLAALDIETAATDLNF